MPADKSLMTNQLRKKLSVVAITIYWPLLFIASHIPMPKAVQDANISDKSLHVLAYFLLAFLLWACTHPYQKVRWCQLGPWRVLLVIACYGVLDEWLQGAMGNRQADMHDFFADIIGATLSLLLLSILPFWPSLLTMSSLTLFFVLHSSRIDLNALLGISDPVLGFLSFSGLSVLWCVYIKRIVGVNKSPAASPMPITAWLFFSSAPPFFLLASVIIAAHIGDKQNHTQNIWAAAGIVTMQCLALIHDTRSTKQIDRPINTTSVQD